MIASPANPRLTMLLRTLTGIEVLVLFAAGVGLFFFPDNTRPLWPWTPAPFNTAFLGAIYLASLAAVFSMFTSGRWSPARIVLPALLVFTVIVLAVSLLYLNQLDLNRWSTYLIWLPLYVILPLSAAYHIQLYRRQSPADPTPTPSAWRAYLLGVSVVVGLYGIGMIIAPATLTAFWPWKIDEFHGRMYSAVFATGAVLAFMVSRAASRAEWITMAFAQGVLAFFSIAGLLIVDASARRVDWTQAGAWLWATIFVVALLASFGMLLRARRMRASA